MKNFQGKYNQQTLLWCLLQGEQRSKGLLSQIADSENLNVQTAVVFCY